MSSVLYELDKKTVIQHDAVEICITWTLFKWNSVTLPWDSQEVRETSPNIGKRRWTDNSVVPWLHFSFRSTVTSMSHTIFQNLSSLNPVAFRLGPMMIAQALVPLNCVRLLLHLQGGPPRATSPQQDPEPLNPLFPVSRECCRSASNLVSEQ